MTEIRIGDVFSSYSEFEAKLKLYTESKFLDFFISDCRTLQSARKRCPNLIAKVPEDIKYYYVKLRCIHGGNYKAKKGNKGIRETSTLKQGCNALMYLKVDESSCKLIVTKLIEDHNHEVSRTLYNHLPKQRRLSPETKQEVFELLELNANKKKVQEKVLQMTGKFLTLRDLSNISVAGMAGKTEDCKINLSELPRKTPVSVSYMVKVPNFFTLPENNDKEVHMKGPAFEFATATWRFFFYSERQVDKASRQFKLFEVYLERLDSEVARHFISYSILLLDADNEMHDHHYGKCAYKEDDVFDQIMTTFKSLNLFYDKRDTLTLIIHLISDELPEANAAQGSLLTNGGITKRRKADERISLSELPRKALFSISYKMELPNFFKLPDNNDTECKVNSKSFDFCNASWQFHFIPVMKKKFVLYNDPEKKFGLYLMRLNSEIRKHLMSFTISFLDEDGEEYNNDCGISLYKEELNDICTWTLRETDASFEERNTLTLIINLICEESPEENVVNNEHNKEHQEDFKKLYLNGKNHDLTLRVAEKEFRVHKDMLMARSPVFESMLTHDMTEKNKEFIDITDCDPQAMEQFLFYVYCGKVETLNKDNVIGLYYIADKYNMDLLKKQCSSFIKKSISPPMTCDVISLSMKHSDSDLLEYATEYFLNHTHDIFTTSEWMSFLTENVTIANELLVKASKKWKGTKS